MNSRKIVIAAFAVCSLGMGGHFFERKNNLRVDFFQGDFLPAGALGSIRNWIPLKNVLVENTLPIPESARGKKGKIMIGMWNPVEGKNLALKGSGEIHYPLSDWEVN